MPAVAATYGAMKMEMKIIFNKTAWLLPCAALGSLVMPGLARANERHFTYTYESATLPKGAAELEPWFTYRAGRDKFFQGFDHRLEFEVAVADRLQTSFYINFSAERAPDAMGVRTTDFRYEGISNEWKYQLLDPRADPVGLALYEEIGLKPDEAEFETKAIVDKWLGDKVLLAGNLVFEPEVVFAQPHATTAEYNLEADLAAAYFFAPNFSVGLEARNHNIFSKDQGFETSTFLLGPVVSYSSHAYWLTFTVMPQLGAVGAAPGDIRDFVDHEKVDARLIVGFELD